MTIKNIEDGFSPLSQEQLQTLNWGIAEDIVVSLAKTGFKAPKVLGYVFMPGDGGVIPIFSYKYGQPDLRGAIMTPIQEDENGEVHFGFGQVIEKRDKSDNFIIRFPSGNELEEKEVFKHEKNSNNDVPLFVKFNDVPGLVGIQMSETLLPKRVYDDLINLRDSVPEFGE